MADRSTDQTPILLRIAGVVYFALWTVGLYWLWFGFRQPNFLFPGDRQLPWGLGGFRDIVWNTIPNPYRFWVLDAQIPLLVVLSILALTLANWIWGKTLGRLQPE